MYGDSDCREAVRAVVADVWDDNNVPEQALIRVMLYLSLNLKRLRRQMKKLGITNRIANQIIGAYLGKSGLEARGGL